MSSLTFCKMSLGLSGVGLQKGFYWTLRHNKCEHVLICVSITTSHTLFPLLSWSLLLQQLHLISLWRRAVLHNPSSRYTAPFSSLPLLLLLPSFPLGPGSHFVHPSLIYLQVWSKSIHFLKTQTCSFSFGLSAEKSFIQDWGVCTSIISSSKHLKSFLSLSTNNSFTPFFPHLHLSSNMTLPHFTHRLKPSFQSQAPASCLSWSFSTLLVLHVASPASPIPFFHLTTLFSAS